MTSTRPQTVDEYIAAAPPEARSLLQELRDILRKVAPDATETIKWGTPVYEQGRILFSFRAHKAHANFMPTAPSLEPFASELASFQRGKDTVQFPYGRRLPAALIRKIARHRLKQVRDHGARWMHR